MSFSQSASLSGAAALRPAHWMRDKSSQELHPSSQPLIRDRLTTERRRIECGGGEPSICLRHGAGRTFGNSVAFLPHNPTCAVNICHSLFNPDLRETVAERFGGVENGLQYVSSVGLDKAPFGADPRRRQAFTHFPRLIETSGKSEFAGSVDVPPPAVYLYGGQAFPKAVCQFKTRLDGESSLFIDEAPQLAGLHGRQFFGEAVGAIELDRNNELPVEADVAPAATDVHAGHVVLKTPGSVKPRRNREFSVWPDVSPFGAFSDRRDAVVEEARLIELGREDHLCLGVDVPEAIADFHRRQAFSKVLGILIGRPDDHLAGSIHVPPRVPVPEWGTGRRVPPPRRPRHRAVRV